MKAGLIRACLGTAILLAPCVVSAAAPIEPDTLSLAEKADPWVMHKLAGEGTAEILVVLREAADVSAARALTCIALTA